MKTALRILFAILGIALCGWLVSHADWPSIRTNLARLGWAAPLVILPYTVVYMADTLGWKLSYGREGTGTARYRDLFKIRWSGEALNNLIPSIYVGGEALKVLLLRRHGVSVGRSTAAAVVSKSTQTLAQLVYLASAALAFSTILPPGSALQRSLWIVMGCSLCVVGLMFWVQSHGMMTLLTGIASRLRFARKAILENRERILAVDRSIAGFYRQERLHFGLSFLSYLAGWFLDTLEIWVAGQLLGMPVTLVQALAVEAFVAVAKVIGLLVPGALGVQETGIIVLGRAAGFPEPFCFAYAVIRRSREIAFALIGWSLLTLQGISIRDLGKAGASLPQPAATEGGDKPRS